MRELTLLDFENNFSGNRNAVQLLALVSQT